MIYYAVLAALTLMALPTRRSTSNFLAIIAGLLVLAVGGLRNEVGTDWLAYEDIFIAVSKGNPFVDFREEPGYLAFVLSISALGGDYPALVFITSAIALGTKILAAYLFRANLNAALMVYFAAVFLIFDLNGVRQGVAMGFVMLAAWAAYKRHIVRFLTAMAAAASFHIFSLIALPIWLLSNRWLFVDDRLLRLALLLAGCATCYVMTLWAPITDTLNSIELLNIQSRFEYLAENFETDFSLLGLGTLQRVLVALIVATMIDTVNAPYRIKALLYNTHAISLFIYFLLSFNNVLMVRLSYYYKGMDIITLGLILAAQKGRHSYSVFVSFLGILCLLQMYQILNIPDGGLLPYRSIFDR